MNETSVNLMFTRCYGRAPGGQQVDAAVTLRNGPNVTVVAALSAQGVKAVMELDGELNTASFVVYLEQVLGPGLQPGEVVVLYNLPVHKADGLAALVEACGAWLLYPPPYSPDFTPIELAFSKLKTRLRTAAARTREALTSALQAALTWITAEDAQNWFDHCGYHVHRPRIYSKCLRMVADTMHLRGAWRHSYGYSLRATQVARAQSASGLSRTREIPYVFRISFSLMEGNS